MDSRALRSYGYAGPAGGYAVSRSHLSRNFGYDHAGYRTFDS